MTKSRWPFKVGDRVFIYQDDQRRSYPGEVLVIDEQPYPFVTTIKVRGEDGREYYGPPSAVRLDK